MRGVRVVVKKKDVTAGGIGRKTLKEMGETLLNCVRTGKAARGGAALKRK